MNPLLDLCRKMGLSIADAARLAGVDAGSANMAMMEEPSAKAIEAYIRICDAIGASLKLRKAAPLAFWFDLATFDALYFNRDFRISRSLPVLPASKLKLRQYVFWVRRKKAKTYQQIVDGFERGHVCTAEGCRNWRRSTIGQILKMRGKMVGANEPLVPDAQCVSDWRDYLKDLIHGAMCPEDVMAPVRYLFTWRESEGRLIFEPAKDMPEKPREWIIAGVSRIPWLTAGCWGLLDPSTMQRPPAGPVQPAGPATGVPRTALR